MRIIETSCNDLDTMIDISGHSWGSDTITPEQLELRQYLQNQINQYQNIFTETTTVLPHLQNQLERYENNLDLNVIKDIQSKMSNVFDPMQLIILETLEDMRFAPPMMQSWVMANPYAGELFNQHRIDGYQDIKPQDERLDRIPVGEDNYYYRRAINGVLRPEESSYITQYIEHIEDPVHENLSLEQQQQIFSLWKAFENYIDEGEDPTSLSGSGFG